MGFGDAFRGIFKKAPSSAHETPAGSLLGLGDLVPRATPGSVASRLPNDSFTEAVAICRTRGGIGQRVVTIPDEAAAAQARVRQALSSVDEELTRDPTSPIASFNKGILLLAGGNPAAAVAYFRTALDASPHDEYARAYYAHVLSLTGRHAEAIDALGDDIEQRPDAYRAVFTTLENLREQLLVACDVVREAHANDHRALFVDAFVRGLPPGGTAPAGNRPPA